MTTLAPAARERGLIAEAAHVRCALHEQEQQWRRGFTRRRFLAGAGMVATATLASQLVTTRYSYAATGVPGAAAASTKTIVSIFLRGGMDGLTAVTPRDIPDLYSNYRPSIGIPQSSLLNLDSTFGLHPALQPLYPQWQNGKMAIVHAAGLLTPNRSHFDAQARMDRGAPSVTTPTGWLDRALEQSGPGTTFRAVSESSAVAPSLAGPSGAVAFEGINSLKLVSNTPEAVAALQALYTGLGNDAEGHMTQTIQVLADAAPLQIVPPPNPVLLGYTADGFGSSMADIAQLIKKGAGLRAATVDVGGWDVHSQAGTVSSGLMKDHLGGFAQTIAAFIADLGTKIADVNIVTMSEFGRRAKENGSGGADHGHGGVMFMIGGGVRGGSMYGSWPTSEAAKFVSDDLVVVNDYRDVLGEITIKTLGLSAAAVTGANGMFTDASYRYAPLGFMQ